MDLFKVMTALGTFHPVGVLEMLLPGILPFYGKLLSEPFSLLELLLGEILLFFLESNPLAMIVFSCLACGITACKRVQDDVVFVR